MNKYIISTISLLCATACFSGSADTDISLEHDFNLSAAATVPSINGMVEDCYLPGASTTFSKINDASSGVSWNISSLQGDVNVTDGIQNINNMTITISDGDGNSVLLNNQPNSVSGNVVHLTATNLDSKLLTTIVKSSTMEICLSVSGNTGNALPSSIHGVVSFHLEADLDKSL